MQLQSTLTCPICQYQAVETMPTDACEFFYDCKGCGARLKPLAQASGVPAHLAQWSWSCSVHAKPGASANGSGLDLEDCKAKFKASWAAIRAGLSEDDIASALEYAENSREALARYDRKQRR
jgi:hypothetical protein